MRRWQLALSLAGALLAHTACAQKYPELLKLGRGAVITPIDNDVFKDHCGSCHYPYQPGWLPARSWEKLLNTAALRRHFGENAALDQDTLRTIHDYAIAHAADKSAAPLSRKVMLSLAPEEVPLRVTDVRYIYRKHHDIPRKMYAGNRDVKSLSNCDKCHTQAERGLFGAGEVVVPNYADWND
ncbi:MAG: cytochrome C [Pseudomonadota bacterium]